MRTFVLALIAVAAAWPIAAGPRQPADAAWTSIEGVAVPAVPTEHPRLYLRARDIGDLRRRVAHPALKPLWDEMQAAAQKDGQVRAEVDALRVLLTGDGELAKRTAAAALQLLEQSRFDPKGQDITRPIGRMMVTGAVVYDWCYTALTPAQKEAFIAQFLRLAKELECGYPPRDNGSVTGHGSEWMIMRDLVSAGIAIFDEHPEMYRLAAGRFFGRHLPARNWLYPGHAHHQGTAYGETRYVADMFPLWIFDRLGAGNVYHPSQQFVPYEWIYLRRPDGKLMRDGDVFPGRSSFSELLSASYYGDGYVLADHLVNPRVGDRDKLFALLWKDPDLEPLPVSSLPLSRYMGFPYGWMAARTGWDERSAIALMKVNVYNFNNHNHADAGTFELYYKGPLAIHSGLYEGKNGAYGSPHHLNYYKRSIAQNTMLVYDPAEKFTSGRSNELRNDGGQRLPNNWLEPRSLTELLRDGYKTGTVTGQGFGPDPQKPAYTYLEGDITEAYSSKVKQVRRAFVFLNLGESNAPAALVVFDRVVSSNAAFRKYWLLHSMEEPVIEGNRATVRLTQLGWTGKLVNTTLLPEPANSDIAKVGGPGKEFWVFGENYPNAPRRGTPEESETGSWRIELSPKQAAETDCFLNVMQIMDGDAAAEAGGGGGGLHAGRPAPGGPRGAVPTRGAQPGPRGFLHRARRR